MSDLHPVTEKVTLLLQQHKAWFETFRHEAVRTSVEASQVRTGYTLHNGAKALIIRVREKGGGKFFVMLVFPADLRFDKGKVKKLFNARDIRFATDQEVSSITGGVLTGGIPPLGILFNLPVIVDNRLFENEKIVFNAGDRRFSVAMKAADYRAIIQPELADITE